MLLRGVIQLSHPNKTQQYVWNTSANNTTGHLLLENGCGGRCKKIKGRCALIQLYIICVWFVLYAMLKCKDSLYDGFDISPRLNETKWDGN